ncbi:MAG: hypothetical protein LBQ15_11070 [Clostridium sp.]|jgi:hypothetical protein|nr:hypothetical protein [Clostridium sp.]
MATAESGICIYDLLTAAELQEIARYTVQKIENCPKQYGKTPENYFHLLFPDEVKWYLVRRDLTRRGMENMAKRREGAQ